MPETILKNITYIIQGCIEKKHQYQRVIYDQYRGYALKIVFRYIFRYEKAVDVVNDGFVKIFSKLHLFHYDGTVNLEMILMGWMRKIMINTSIDWLRKNNFLPEIGVINDGIWIEDKSQSADQSLLYKELILEIKKLPPGYRAVFNMYVIDGFTHQEISNRLQIAVGTSKSNLSKARVLLQKFIKVSDKVVNICNM